MRDWLLLIIFTAPVWLTFLIGSLLVFQLISRGMGSLKGCPLPPRWWEQP